MALAECLRINACLVKLRPNICMSETDLDHESKQALLESLDLYSQAKNNCIALFTGKIIETETQENPFFMKILELLTIRNVFRLKRQQKLQGMHSVWLAHCLKGQLFFYWLVQGTLLQSHWKNNCCKHPLDLLLGQPICASSLETKEV